MFDKLMSMLENQDNISSTGMVNDVYLLGFTRGGIKDYVGRAIELHGVKDIPLKIYPRAREQTLKWPA